MKALSENAKQILKLVAANPGQFNRKQIVSIFDADDHRSVALTIGRLLGKGSNKLVEANGFLFLNERRTVTKTTVHQVVAEDTKAVPARTLNFEPVFQEPYTLPDAMKGRKIQVRFQIVLIVDGSKRIGIASDTRKDTIVWLPLGSKVLLAQTGEYELKADMEMSGKYLAVVVSDKKGGHIINYYESPTKERFALSWVSDDADEKDDE